MRIKEKNKAVSSGKLLIYLLFSCFMLFGITLEAKGESDEISQKDTTQLVTTLTADKITGMPKVEKLRIPGPPPESKIILNSSNAFYRPNGNDTGISADGRMWVITSGKNQAGTMWAQEKLNLDKDFTMIAHIYLGDNGTKANDGITFTMHSDNRGGAAISDPDKWYGHSPDLRGNFFGVYGGFAFPTKANGGGAHIFHKKNILEQAVSIEFDTYLNVGKGGYYVRGYEHQDEAISKMTGAGKRNDHKGHIAQVFPGEFNADYLDYVNKDPNYVYPSPQATEIGMKDISRKHWNPVIAHSPMANGRWKRIQVDWKAASRTLSVNSSDGIDTINQSVTYSATEVRNFWSERNKSSGVWWGFTGGSSDEPTVNIVSVEQMPQQTTPPETQKDGVEHEAKIKNISKQTAEGYTTSGARGERVQLKSITKLKSGFTSQKVNSLTANLDNYLQYQAGSAKLDNRSIPDNQLIISGNTVKYNGANLNLTSSKKEYTFTIEATIKNTAPTSTTLNSTFTAAGGDLSGILNSNKVVVNIGGTEKPPENSESVGAIISVRKELNDPKDQKKIHVEVDKTAYIRMSSVKLSGALGMVNGTYKISLLKFVNYQKGSAVYGNGSAIPASNIIYNEDTHELIIKNLSGNAVVDFQVSFGPAALIGYGLPFHFEIEGGGLSQKATSNEAVIYLDKKQTTSPNIKHTATVDNGTEKGTKVSVKENSKVTYEDKISLESQSSSDWENGQLEIKKDSHLTYDENTIKINNKRFPTQNIKVQTDKIILTNLPTVTSTKALDFSIEAVVNSNVVEGESYPTSFVALGGNLSSPVNSEIIMVEVPVKKMGIHIMEHLYSDTGKPVPNESDITLTGEIGTSIELQETVIPGHKFKFLVPSKTITFEEKPKTTYLYYEKIKEIKYLSVPKIDFGTLDIKTNFGIKNYPIKDVELEIQGDVGATWHLNLKIKDSFKTENNVPLKGQFYFKNEQSKPKLINSEAEEVFNQTNPPPQLSDYIIRWDRAKEQGLSFVNEPGNLTERYNGTFEWNLVDGPGTGP